jgi:hypothetical protein
MNAVVHDNLFSRDLIRAARESWPAADWPGWVNYDPATQCKRASDLATPLPAACGQLLAELAALRVGAWFPSIDPLVPDLGLRGAGLHEMPPGPGLAPHLDADTHARLGVARVLSAVLWIHELWTPLWGGELEFASGLVVAPDSGRLVIFDCCTEQHAVRPVTCPADVRRQSLAVFWYAPRPGPGRRLHADFARPGAAP